MPRKHRERVQRRALRPPKAALALLCGVRWQDGSVRVLITSSRMPFALGMVRRLAGEGRAIYAADD